MPLAFTMYDNSCLWGSLVKEVEKTWSNGFLFLKKQIFRSTKRTVDGHSHHQRDERYKESEWICFYFKMSANSMCLFYVYYIICYITFWKTKSWHSLRSCWGVTSSLGLGFGGYAFLRKWWSLTLRHGMLSPLASLRNILWMCTCNSSCVHHTF